MEAKCMNCCISAKGQKKYEWYKDDLISYIDDLKYEHFIKNMDDHFTRAKIVNFDLIYHKCCGDELSYPKYFYEKIEKNDFQSYETEVKAEAVASAVQSERKDVRVKIYVVEDYFKLNDFFVKLQKKRLKRKKDRRLQVSKFLACLIEKKNFVSEFQIFYMKTIKI